MCDPVSLTIGAVGAGAYNANRQMHKQEASMKEASQRQAEALKESQVKAPPPLPEQVAVGSDSQTVLNRLRANRASSMNQDATNITSGQTLGLPSVNRPGLGVQGQNPGYSANKKVVGG